MAASRFASGEGATPNAMRRRGAPRMVMARDR
ncbi:hypothetical protein Mnod_6938 [Methylobacterium nodulans ORS 2060]|uniref:Uncharacterized protein n=1 Tax=Methylobacterium nodulans (strain LMG 21967 / CNCM I-2342 / ORS 2060) TaxID=460265 RepID=B8IHM0_METNO|nr:hypothetical protein Mnod_6938 [Methylobacterium nodulans ORS 2060]